MIVDVFHNFCLFFVTQIQNDVFNSSSKPLQEACSGFLIVASASKSSSKSRLRSLKMFRKSAINVHWRKSTKEKEEKPKAETEI
jgi:hypothetical protein